MAELGDANGQNGGSYYHTTAIDAGRAVHTPVTPKPAPQGGLIIVTSTGGVRG